MTFAGCSNHKMLFLFLIYSTVKPEKVSIIKFFSTLFIHFVPIAFDMKIKQEGMSSTQKNLIACNSEIMKISK